MVYRCGGVVTFNEAFSFPTTDGTANQVLQTDGAGAVTWATAGGSNIATSDLTISATGTRYLKMAGSAATDKFQLQKSNGDNLWWFNGDGGHAIGWLSDNTGAGTYDNIVIGTLADNNGYRNTTMIGRSAKGHAIGAVAVGYQAEAGLHATAIGYNTDASAGQYNTSIGSAASCTGFYNVALGKDADAYNHSTALGAGAGALSDDSIAIGRSAIAPAGVNSKRSICIGRNASTTAQGAVTLGYDTLSSGIGSISIGSGMETTANYSVVLGALAYAQTRTNTDANAFAVYLQDTDPTIKIHTDNDSWIDSTGSFGFNTMTPDASAVIDLTSTTKGFLPPRMTTTERDAISTPAEGLVIYNTTTQVLNFYNGSSWGAV